MPVKSFREMTNRQRKRHSLSARAVRALLVFSIFMGVIALTFGFHLYTGTVVRDYRTDTWHTARNMAAAVDQEQVRKLSEEVLAVYDSLPEASRGANDDAYYAQFADIMDGDFDDVANLLREIRDNGECMAGYIAALDEANNRMIFIVDSDEKDTFCPPGKVDPLDEEYVQGMLYGVEVNRIEAFFGRGTSIPAVLADIEDYGYRCTAAAPMMKIGDYTVMAFADTDMNHVAFVSQRFLFQYLLILVAVAAVAIWLMFRYTRRHIVGPINKLAEAAKAYSEDKRRMGETGLHFADLGIHTGDEIENLALTIQDMETDLTDYVANLTQVTAEKERFNTELSVASSIQEGMIPHIFPAFPERPEFDLHAGMHTAKEVGGDFYDFFLIDETHLALVIADVSGKGIPAALFMMGSKIMIQNYAKTGDLSPAHTLEKVNDQICSNNSADMFVTVWLGILDLTTGRLTAANAGREYPALKRAGGRFEMMKEPHGFIIGGMAGVPYQDYTIDLAPGDTIFQYTDGVTEATSGTGAMFGTDSMLAALNEEADAAPEQILAHVGDAVKAFAGDAKQFDDITMLCLRYNGVQAQSEQ